MDERKDVPAGARATVERVTEDVATWLRDGFDGCAEHVVLAHLSQRANNPDLARFTAESALRERGGLFQPATRITLSHHKEPTPWIEL